MPKKISLTLVFFLFITKREGIGKCVRIKHLVLKLLKKKNNEQIFCIYSLFIKIIHNST